jgi:hypothetical protein
MKRSYRVVLFAVAFCGGLLASIAPVPAAIDLSVGIRHVSDDGTLQDCSSKARSSLNAFLQNASEPVPGSGDWSAYSSNGPDGTPAAAAAVRCYALPKGYVVTFTCVIQSPASPYTPDALCLNIAHKFYGGAITSLAPMPTPSPIPTGCATNSLVGTWMSDDKPGFTFKMELNGDLTDSDGVSGNWILKGNTAVLTYYGEHSMTLSPDGKHLRGGGYSLTRKC